MKQQDSFDNPEDSLQRSDVFQGERELNLDPNEDPRDFEYYLGFTHERYQRWSRRKDSPKRPFDK